jgi:hypothetical protein
MVQMFPDEIFQQLHGRNGQGEQVCNFIIKGRCFVSSIGVCNINKKECEYGKDKGVQRDILIPTHMIYKCFRQMRS